MPTFTLDSIQGEFKKMAEDSPYSLKLGLKKAANAVRRWSRTDHFTQGDKSTDTKLAKGRGLIFNNIYLDYSRIERFISRVYVGGPAIKPARVHDPLDGRKITIIRPINAKKLFIPTELGRRKRVLPDRNWKSRKNDKSAPQPWVDFIFADKARIKARPFLTPVISERAEEIKTIIANEVYKGM